MARKTEQAATPAEEKAEAKPAPVNEQAARLRAQHAAGLATELAYLERRPSPDAKRIAAVKEQISLYSGTPARKRETR